MSIGVVHRSVWAILTRCGIPGSVLVGWEQNEDVK